MDNFIPLDSIQLATPCSADWNAMPGDSRTRFCASCAKNVYNLSAMSRDEAQRAAPLQAVLAYPVLRKPAATPLIDSWMPRCTRSSTLFSLDRARWRLISSTCKWFSGSR